MKRRARRGVCEHSNVTKRFILTRDSEIRLLKITKRTHLSISIRHSSFTHLTSLILKVAVRVCSQVRFFFF